MDFKTPDDLGYLSDYGIIWVYRLVGATMAGRFIMEVLPRVLALEGHPRHALNSSKLRVLPPP